jgi:hypothetical protein
MAPTLPKYAGLIHPAAIYDDASATSQVVDTKGYDWARVVFYLGATDIAMAALYLQESDDNSTNTNISGTVFGTDALITGSTSALPSSTADNTFQIVELDLRKRKRYLQAVATAGNGSSGTYLTAWIELHRGEALAATAAQAGAAQIIRV